jgi:hypothetical protein
MNITVPQKRRSAVLRVAAALLASIAIAVPVHAAVAEGTQPKEFPANPAKHTVTVRREAADKAQSALIATAEAALPEKAALGKAAGEKGAPQGEKVWWYQEQLGIRIPFAITGDAVSYYSDLVEKYGKRTFNRYVEPSSRLEYNATVKLHKEFKLDGKTFLNVHVVTLKLKFSQNFAATTTEGMQFEKERTVVLDADGKVLHISGDGTTDALILAI